MPGLWLFFIYLALISLFAIIITVYDKNIAKKNEHASRKKRRVPEKTLLIIAAMGGSVAMYITMKKIRHKTQHKKFMVGIPAIIAGQILLAVLLIWIF